MHGESCLITTIAILCLQTTAQTLHAEAALLNRMHESGWGDLNSIAFSDKARGSGLDWVLKAVNRYILNY